MLASPFAKAVVLKLCVFALVLVVSAVHDFQVGPRATLAIETDPRSGRAEILRKRASSTRARQRAAGFGPGRARRRDRSRLAALTLSARDGDGLRIHRQIPMD
jgi:hypothetical protein